MTHTCTLDTPPHTHTHTQFFQDPKYKSFRPDDYHTPLGLANHPQPRGVV